MKINVQIDVDDFFKVYDLIDLDCYEHPTMKRFKQAMLLAWNDAIKAKKLKDQRTALMNKLFF